VKHARNDDNCNIVECYSMHIIVHVTMFTHFQHDGQKPEVVLFNCWSCCRPLSIEAVYIYGLVYSLFWIMNDDNICKKTVTLSPLPVIVRLLGYIEQTMVSPAVSQDRVHAAKFVTPFRLWNDVSIFAIVKL